QGDTQDFWEARINALPNNGSVCRLPIRTGIRLRNGKGLGSNCPWQMRNVFGR
uniref:Uncharacterized protein n=1 Tax=Anas zonorhyncha TaxID=75864 RepID=A0A8B9VZN4_9AVES